MIDKSTNELEDIIVEYAIGGNPGIERHDDMQIKASKFVNWCFMSDDIKKKLKEKHQSEWQIIKMTASDLPWLDYYKRCLIQHIRDLKLKSIID